MTPVAAILSGPPAAVAAPAAAVPGFEALLATLTVAAAGLEGEVAPVDVPPVLDDAALLEHTVPQAISSPSWTAVPVPPFVTATVREAGIARPGVADAGTEIEDRPEALDTPDAGVDRTISPVVSPMLDLAVSALTWSPAPPAGSTDSICQAGTASPPSQSSLFPPKTVSIPSVASPLPTASLASATASLASLSGSSVEALPPSASPLPTASTLPSTNSASATSVSSRFPVPLASYQLQPVFSPPSITSSSRTRGPISETSSVAVAQFGALQPISVASAEQGDVTDFRLISDRSLPGIDPSGSKAALHTQRSDVAFVTRTSADRAPPATAVQTGAALVGIAADALTNLKVGRAGFALRLSRQVRDDFAPTTFAAPTTTDVFRLVAAPVTRVGSNPDLPAPIAVDATVRDTGDGFALATERLGGLHIALDPGDQALRVHVTAERSATASLIAAQTDRLQAAVETGGQRLAALSVDVRDGDGGRRALPWQQPSGSPRRAVAPTVTATRSPDRFA